MAQSSVPPITIPADLLPKDGRFGSGPTKVRGKALAALAESGAAYLGTSHRKPPVRSLVQRIREGLASYYDIADTHEVVLGNGGATLFWDAACFSLINHRSAHAVFGEFSERFARSVAIAPHLDDPVTITAPIGTCPTVGHIDGVDTYALTHHETSTAVTMSLDRPSDDGVTIVDATSAAGAIPFDPANVDVYYFSPQKAFGAEGGLFVAFLNEAAQHRITQIASSQRPIPPILDIGTALHHSKRNQTLNTPSVASLFMLANNVEWLAERGLDQVYADVRAKSDKVYTWAEEQPWASPFVTDPSYRSPVVCTVDLVPTIDADTVIEVLRLNGILDTDRYRKLGKNQLRLGTFPAVDDADVDALLSCISYVVEHLTS